MTYLFFATLAFCVAVKYTNSNTGGGNYKSIIVKYYELTFVLAWIGAKMLGLLVMLHRNEVFTFREFILRGDLVYYGGLYGTLVSIKFLLPLKYANLLRFRKYMVCSIPLFHAISRIGCFCVGCCHGIEIEGIRVPIQLVEAIAELFIFSILAFEKSKIDKLITYVFLYGIIRFFLEFLRGDMERGIIWNLSVAQWLSIINILICAMYVIRKKRQMNVDLAKGDRIS